VGEGNGDMQQSACSQLHTPQRGAPTFLKILYFSLLFPMCRNMIKVFLPYADTTNVKDKPQAMQKECLG